MGKVKKILAVFLIYTMTFSNFAFVVKSFATTGATSIFGTNVTSKDVSFDAYFSSKDDASKVMISDVNDNELKLKFNVQVQNGGYLKDGKVEIKAKDNEELNFSVKEDNHLQEQENVQSLENNVLKLKKIDDSSGEVEISVPIEYVMEEYIKDSKLDSKASINLTGTYIDNKGKKNEISKEVELELVWKDEKKVKVDTEVSKYINFEEDGVILQTMVKVDSLNENEKSLPVKNTELNVKVPKINETLPTDVTIVANSTMGTNGKSIGEVEFSKDNWSYNEEENTINIHVENNKQLVNINENEYLKENEEVKQEERYYSKAGIDEFLITYSYRNVEMSEEMMVESKASAKITLLSNNQEEIKAENTKQFTLTGQTGEIVSYNIENETKDISKIYAYLNKEAEYKSKTAINISYQDIVEEIMVEDSENYYIDKSGNRVAGDDLYYKQLFVNKDNFNEILGENGYIQVLDIFGKELIMINHELETDENGNYVINFQDRISRIILKTSKPENTGNLIISNTKAVSNVSMEKEDYKNLEYIATDTKQRAKFTYVSDYVNLGECTVKTILNDTTTDINVIVDKESLSTVTTNSDVEMRIELNNDELTSDIYENSVFELEMPEYVTNVNVTNANMIYGEGLEISNVSSYEKNGRIVVGIETTGKQTDINSGVLTNGTNIVLNADIDVDMYAPSQETTIKTHIYNGAATNYANTTEYIVGNTEISGYEETEIEYSAPYGVVSINTLANYEATGKTLTSVKEGSKSDYIDIYSEAVRPTMEIAVMNNYENAVSDVVILGRIPFEGVKDIDTDKELGTTINTKLVSKIVKSDSTIGDFTIYYSENGEATKDLSNTSNNWKKEVESLANIKSYMIVPNDTSYVLEPGKVLKFSYEYEIPENLEHNEYIYGTFATLYKMKETEEISVADKVGLTTGRGPTLEVNMKTDTKNIKPLEKMNLTVIVKNTGEDVARDVVANIPMPSNMSYVSGTTNNSLANITLADNTVVCNLSELARDTELEITITLSANNISKYMSNEVDFTAEVLAKDLKKELVASADKVTIQRSELALTQMIDTEAPSIHFEKGTQLNIILYVANLTDTDKSDAVVETQLPEGIKFVKGYTIEGTTVNDYKMTENATYEEASHKVNWNIGTLKANSGKNLKLTIEIGDISSGLTAKSVTISSQVYAKDTESCKAEDIILNMGKNSLDITQTTTTSTYITEGDIIYYIFTIKNEGSTPANNILLTDLVPDGITVKSIAYTIDGHEVRNDMSETKNAELELTIPANSTLDVTVMAVADDLEGLQEKSVTNGATLAVDESSTIESNSVTHIVQAIPESRDENSSTSTNNGVSGGSASNNNSDITKSYKVSGTAWLDANKNGMKDDDEKRMAGITAILVDSASGVIKNTVTTGNNGEYTFAGIENGSYLVLFKYDTVAYTVTTYRKEGVETNINSDAVTTKIEQDGKQENGAITDVINVNGANVANIDLGLVEADKFSLGLDKSISKVTVQNSQGTKTENFENTKLAQCAIKAKYLTGTTVYVEYTFTVTNNGDVAGYATEIVDYIPEGMSFNSNLNSDWYTGTDGMLYTKALANTELKAGESKTVTLVLTKKMNAENTDIVSNTAEIANDYNIYGISDHNSKPGNKAQGEDDISTADIIMTVSTGETLVYISVMIISLLIASGAVIRYL